MQFPPHTTAVLLPGSGSDADFALRAFAPLTALCARTVAVDATPPSVVAGYRAALDEATSDGPLLICGVSLGSAVGASWALEHPGADVTLVLTLPPWCGAAGPDVPAAMSARVTANVIDEVGATEAIARMRAGSPPWLARELSRSWAAHGDFLAPALREASGYAAPTEVALGGLVGRAVVVGAEGDLIHPVATAHAWAAAIPHATVEVVDLADLGPDPAVLGRAGLAGLTAVC
ncbi:alpha/beta hydrolase [Tsukamurella ocularis]|uniref:alpha/beta hydrolase n=1 Tax=Tsukamurella ocularis TaxID=1970234 RepID=UPI002168ED57|nr:alpha/beta hydrolase [Tsukamurella ocularis]MCS3780050.1 pimeloyl-ACP methyl ester carboxylesterase [Tsukamurella ocularis]MCS3786396.1 pimeloyl-ACP methyl ester carboxylesterase [Tsukamurella ocularis]MCS3849760.1 pimeloyl-ACP methyl ester carboxylesterase [Tsukamurella ocularis]